MEQTQQTKLKAKLMETYHEFWNNKSFSKGYNTPICSYAEIEKLLDTTADLVLKIMASRNITCNPMEFGPTEQGTSHDYLWGLTEHPQCNPQSFIHGLAHATLKNTEGYMYGLTYDLVESLLCTETGNSCKSGLEQAQACVKELSCKLDNLLGLITPAKQIEFLEEIQEAGSSVLGLAMQAVERANQVIVLLQQQTQAPTQPENSEEQTQQEHQEQPTAEEVGMSVEKAVDEPAATPMETETPKTEEVQTATSTSTEPPMPEPMVVETTEVSQQEQGETEQKEVPVPKQETPAVVLQISRIGEEVDTLRGKISDFEKSTELLDLQELTKNPLDGLKQVEKLQNKCREYSEYLMRDLLQLDSMETPGNSRQARKEQVITIQGLIDTMDGVSSRLTDLRKQLEEEKNKASPPPPETDPETEPKVVSDSEEADRSSPVTSRERRRLKQSQERIFKAHTLPWGEMKLKPKFHVNEGQGSYLISASIPGVSKDSIKLDLARDESLLVLEGLREPTTQELAQMEMWVKTRCPPTLAKADRATALLQLGAGHFGKFSEKFQLPEDVDTKRIQATYEGGVLKVLLPKIQRKRPVFGPSGFFGDTDYWW